MSNLYSNADICSVKKFWWSLILDKEEKSSYIPLFCYICMWMYLERSKQVQYIQKDKSL